MNFLGIEFGSTRIKAVLTDEKSNVVAQGVCEWENKFANGIWTYGYDEIISGLQNCYRDLRSNYFAATGKPLGDISAIGISAMMHGLIALDENNKPLAPFKTWRCGDAEREAKELTDIFGYPIAARWTIAHLYKAIKDDAEYLAQVKTVTTLAGYVHSILTERNVLGIGDASGMFPIDIDTCDYDMRRVKAFDELACSKLKTSVYDLLPDVLLAGRLAGRLSDRGAKLLDPSGELECGIPFCPPEGDAGTGMVATNSVKPRTGNVSVGTSVFSMAVLDGPLANVYDGVDVVTTPDGHPVAMVHCNNCSSEINAWIDLFAEASGKPKAELYDTLFKLSLVGEQDCGGTVVCNYLSGENITEISKGTPFVMHSADGRFTLANFMRAQLYSALATLKIGNDRFAKKENVMIEKYHAHGGLFKTAGVCQNYLAAALDTPVSVMSNANEGGAWGMAVLAAFSRSGEPSLAAYLDEQVFGGVEEITVEPCAETVKGFNAYVEKLSRVIGAEKIFAEV